MNSKLRVIDLFNIIKYYYNDIPDEMIYVFNTTWEAESEK